MTPPFIRTASPFDVDALSRFAAAVFHLGCPETALSDLAAFITAELSPQRFRAMLEDRNLIVLLAESSQCIVAYMVVAKRSLHASLPATPTPAEFRKLYIDPTYHGTGLSGALIGRAFSAVEAEGARPVWLSVFSENSRAICFYEKWGFQIVGSQQFLVGTDSQKDFLMLRAVVAGSSSGS
jgi:ribosomal protein S18 acetylase RimI-like enzyme